MKPLDFNLSGFSQSVSDAPALLGGRYKVIDHLGSGGFGQTFLAEDLHLPNHPRCVVKQLNPQISDEAGLKIAHRLFETEAKVLYKLGDHNQIPQLLAHFQESQEFYLAQELIEGNSLSDELETNKVWPQAKAAALLHDVLTVLAFVHDQKVIHRDIKPSNLIRRHRDGRIVLIDFGAVKQVSTQMATSPGATNLTVSIGTKGYMPNEQLGGNPRFSSDLYALGMICIQALTGMPPQYLDEDPHTGEAIWRDLAPDLDPTLADIIDGMVRYDYRERYSNASLPLQHLSRLPAKLQQAAQAFQQPIPPGTDPAATNKSFFSAFSLVGKSIRSKQRQASAPAPSRGGQESFSASAAQSRFPLTNGQSRQSGTRGLILLASLAAVLGVTGLGSRTILPSLLAKQTTVNPEATGVADASSPFSTRVFANSGRLVSIATLNSQANALQATQHYPEALKLYDQVAQLIPQDEGVQVNRCAVANQAGAYDQAIAACDEANAINPNNPQVAWNKGYALEQQNKPEEALVLFDRAIEIAPDFADAWNSKGTVLQKLDRLNDAINAYDEAIALDPALTEAQTNRETVVVRQNQEAEVARQVAAAAARRAAASSQPVAAALEIQRDVQRNNVDVDTVRSGINIIRRQIGR